MATEIAGEFEWNTGKALENAPKHGVTYMQASRAFLDLFAVDLPDATHAHSIPRCELRDERRTTRSLVFHAHQSCGRAKKLGAKDVEAHRRALGERRAEAIDRDVLVRVRRIHHRGKPGEFLVIGQPLMIDHQEIGFEHPSQSACQRRIGEGSGHGEEKLATLGREVGRVSVDERLAMVDLREHPPRLGGEVLNAAALRKGHVSDHGPGLLAREK